MYNHPLIKFTLFGETVKIYPYGICIAIGILCCLAVFRFYTDRRKIDVKVQDFMFFMAFFAIIIGFLSAKLFQAFYDYLAHPEAGFDFAGAGKTAMGGFVGGILGGVGLYFGVGHFYFRGKDKGLHLKYFLTIVTVAPLCILIAHAFGRIGCLFAGCCHGKFLGTSYVFGGIFMEPGGSPSGYYVPIQLYEALFLFVLFAVCTLLYYKNFTIIPQVYLVGYGVWRFIVEFLRTDYRGGAGFFSPSQVQSFIFIGAGILLFFVYKWLKISFRTKKNDCHFLEKDNR
ncbi:MAG: prolipoprotein diacylglyceryl transferase [Clostridiales bacterium]|nr:prolipoprotein diacylglyceryl transferase [Clostridiales bacterium]